MSTPTLTRTAAALLATALFCGAVRADTIKLADGSQVGGRATAYDAGTKVLSFRADDGRDVSYRLDQLDPRSVYQVTRSKVPKDSGRGQLQLANFARDAELWAHAVRHYGWAVQADPTLQEEVDREVGVLRRRAATWGMAQARAAIEKKDYKEAEKWLTKLIQKLPDEPEAAEARGMLDRYYDHVHAERDAELRKANEALLAKELKVAKQHYDEMIESNKQGLTSSGSGSRSVSAWERAIKEGGRALEELDEIAGKIVDPRVSETIAGYREVVSGQLVETHLNLASHWTVRTSYNKAQSEVNRALAIDPNNQAALAMRARIEEAASRGLGWW
jgi:tetratricopeptide (TPR) repeat protein